MFGIFRTPGKVLEVSPCKGTEPLVFKFNIERLVDDTLKARIILPNVHPSGVSVYDVMEVVDWRLSYREFLQRNSIGERDVSSAEGTITFDPQNLKDTEIFFDIRLRPLPPTVVVKGKVRR